MSLFSLLKFRHNRKEHWERVYKNKSPDELSWYQNYPETSLKLIESARIGIESRIIDIGGGASKLIDYLLNQGYKNLTVLDISGNAIKKAKLRLGEQADKIKWIEMDITNFQSKEKYDLWHDRAVFHFLTDISDRKNYITALNNALNTGGEVIIAAFSLAGPQKCSGLKICRYDAKSLHTELGDNLELIEAINEVHLTPTKVKQNFIYCHFKKVQLPTNYNCIP